jgi:undecaprenyl-diphosphatase
MFEKLIQLDKQLLIFLNNLGAPEWDPIWLYITKQFNWVPVFVVVLFLFFKFLGWKKGVFLLFFLAVLITFSDQFVNMIRAIFERLRPNNDPAIQNQLRTMINPQNFSFISGHATTSTVVAVFAVLTLKKYTKYIYLFFLFPLLFAYSRLYLGVHFPIDITIGVTVGAIFGTGAAKLFGYCTQRYFT